LFEASVTEQVTVVVPFGKIDPLAGEHAGAPTFGQLSFTAGLKETTAEQEFASLPVTMFDGQLMVGACVSFTVTVNDALPEFPAASLTEQLTVVVPFGNSEPEAGLQDGEPTPGQLSLTVGVNVTSAEHSFGSVFCVIFA
jgi:hypothetical protein